MLIFLIILFIIFISTSFLIFIVNNIGKFWKILRVSSIILFGIVLIPGLILYSEFAPKKVQYEVFKQSIEELKQIEDGLKSSYITSKIIEVNQQLITAKYYENTILGLFIPDSYSKLEIIKFNSEKNK